MGGESGSAVGQSARTGGSLGTEIASRIVTHCRNKGSISPLTTTIEISATMIARESPAAPILNLISTSSVVAFTACNDGASENRRPHRSARLQSGAPPVPPVVVVVVVNPTYRATPPA
jgi:hypothetical protein